MSEYNPNAPRAQAPKGGRRSRDKGARAERLLVRQLQDFGIAAQRIPLSGSVGGKFVGDVSLPLLGADRVCEVKCRADGFATLYAWLEGRDLLALKRDRDDFLIVLPFRIFRTLAIASEASCVRTPRGGGGDAVQQPQPKGI